MRSQIHTYPFGGLFEGEWNRSTKYNYLYTGQERQISFDLGYERYKNRFGDPWILGRFDSPDPISTNFPFINSYNMAENRVPNGIDLHGLQFLSNTDARIIFTSNGTRIDINNSSRATQSMFQSSGGVVRTNSSGGDYLGYTIPTELSSFSLSNQSKMKRSRAVGGAATINVGNLSNASGSSHQRAKVRTAYLRMLAAQNLRIGNNTVPYGKGRSGGVLGLLFLIEEAADYSNQNMIISDISMATEQDQLFTNKILSFLTNASENNLLEGFNSEQIGEIGNYMLRGEFVKNYADETFTDMREAAQYLMQHFGIQLNCSECQQDQN